MKKFVSFETVRNDALRLAHKICDEDGFVPDIIYASMRGGAYMANVISEYYKFKRPNEKPVIFAAVVASSYNNVNRASELRIDGWTYDPKNIRKGDKIMVVDDIYDSGNTISAIVNELLRNGAERKNIKVVVHDYKQFIYGTRPVTAQFPDYYCNLITINEEKDDEWIHYLSHELVGLTKEELAIHYGDFDFLN